MTDLLQLSVYFGESDRVEGELLSDALLDVYEEQRIETAILLRGIEGYGTKHRLHTQRLLTLSEDLPLVAVAIDAPERIEAVASQATELVAEGLLTVERARALEGTTFPSNDVKLTVYTGRTERPGPRAIVELLRSAGLAGATVLLGVDGMRHGERCRARFLSANGSVPLAVVAVGSAGNAAAARDALLASVERPAGILERVQICKRDGQVVAPPEHVSSTDAAGLPLWQKLTVYAPERARHGSHPLYVELVRRLRLAGAAGATALRGIWGYSGDHSPHGDRPFSVGRRVPVVTTIVDRPPAIGRWWEIVDELTAEAGLVTSEIVPAFRAVGPTVPAAGLDLAEPARSSDLSGPCR